MFAQIITYSGKQWIKHKINSFTARLFCCRDKITVSRYQDHLCYLVF